MCLYDIIMDYESTVRWKISKHHINIEWCVFSFKYLDALL